MKIYILKLHEKYHKQCIVLFVILVVKGAIYSNDNLSDEIDTFYINLLVATLFFVATFVNDYFKNISLSKFDKRKNQYYNLRSLKEVYESFLNVDRDRSLSDFVMFRSMFLEDKDNPDKPFLIEYDGFNYSQLRKELEKRYQRELNYLIKRIEKNMIYRLSPDIKKDSFYSFGFNLISNGNKTKNFNEMVKSTLNDCFEFDEYIENQLSRVLDSLKWRIILFESLKFLLLISARRDYKKIIDTLDKIENVYSFKLLQTSKFEDDTYYNFSNIKDRFNDIQRNLDDIENRYIEGKSDFDVFERELFTNLQFISNQIEDVDIKVDDDFNSKLPITR